MSYRLPDAIQAPSMRLVIDAYVASSDEFAAAAHAAIDVLAESGQLDPTGAAVVEKRLGEVGREIALREAALERQAQEGRLAAEQAALDEIDRRAEEALAK